MKNLAIILLTFILCVSSNLVQAQSLDAVVADYFSAIGGIEKWRKVNTLYYNSKCYLSNGDTTFIKHYMKTPYSLRIESKSTSETLVSVHTPTLIWRSSNDRPARKLYDKAESKDEEKDKIFGQRSNSNVFKEFPFWLIDTKKHFDTVVYVGRKKFRGGDYEVVELVDIADEPSISQTGIRITSNKVTKKIIYFNINTHLIDYEQSVQSSIYKTADNFLYRYLDYQNYNGYLLPKTREEFRSDGTLERRVERIELKVNQPIDDSLFAFPATED